MSYGIERPGGDGNGRFADETAHQFGAGSVFKGTGLGMAIAKRNVELNGGKISVASQRGKGTVVTMTFPIGNVAPKNVENP